MDDAIRKQIISIIDDADDLTIATVRADGYPQATTVSYINDGMTIYFGTVAASQKARNITENDKVSVTINRAYANWGEIEGLSIGGKARPVSEPGEQQKVGELMLAKFPQMMNYVPADMPPEDLALFRVDPQVISLLDYRKGFGHTELFEISQGRAPADDQLSVRAELR